jgi:hypothetical protein
LVQTDSVLRLMAFVFLNNGSQKQAKNSLRRRAARKKQVMITKN